MTEQVKSNNFSRNSGEKHHSTQWPQWLIEGAVQKTIELKSGSLRKVMQIKQKISQESKDMSHVSVHGPAAPSLAVTHLSDGCAELTLKDLLQRLELVTGNVTRLLQFLQQLDGPGNIWQKQGEKEVAVSVHACVYSCQGDRGEEKKNSNSITLTAQPRKRRWSESMGGIMEIDSVKGRRSKKDRIAIPSMNHLHRLSSMCENKGGEGWVRHSFVQR